MGAGKLADSDIPGWQLSGLARHLRRSRWQRAALYARQCALLWNYPGLRVPRPLLLVPHQNTDSNLQTLAKDVLALTKVNWNTTQFDQKLPAPIKAAREVGRILKHVEYGTVVSPDFRRYT